MRRIRVEDAKGRAASAVELTEPFEVILEYELKEPISGLVVGVEVQSDELGLAVISSSDCELDPQLLSQRKPGRYRARVRIPERILNTGIYRIRSALVQGRDVIDVVESPTFRIDDHIGIVGTLGYDRKSSVTALQLPWEVERIESA
jgi:lipopolysaccharide transport system ATP-binding protein